MTPYVAIQYFTLAESAPSIHYADSGVYPASRW